MHHRATAIVPCWLNKHTTGYFAVFTDYLPSARWFPSSLRMRSWLCGSAATAAPATACSAMSRIPSGPTALLLKSSDTSRLRLGLRPRPRPDTTSAAAPSSPRQFLARFKCSSLPPPLPLLVVVLGAVSGSNSSALASALPPRGPDERGER